MRISHSRPGFRVQGSGFRVWSSGFEVRGSGYKVSQSRVQGAGCRVQGSGCRVQGSGFRVQGAGCSKTSFSVMLRLKETNWGSSAPFAIITSARTYRVTAKVESQLNSELLPARKSECAHGSQHNHTGIFEQQGANRVTSLIRNTHPPRTTIGT